MAGALSEAKAGRSTPRPGSRLTRAGDRLWRFLRHPAVAIVLAALLLGLLLIARIIPQIPGQAVEDPAAAARWLNAERDAWGAWGGLLRALGFFAVATSPLFLTLIASLALVCGVHLAALLANSRLPRQLMAAFNAPAGVSPLPLTTTDGLLQLRLAHPNPPPVTASRLHATLAAAIGPVQERILASPDAATQSENRLLAMAGMRGLMLRPLLPLGALLALGVLWFSAAFGWNVRPPALAPSDSYTAPAHNVTLNYAVPAEGDATLEVAVADESATLPARSGSTRVGGATVQVQEAAPALLLRVETPLLALPGAPENRTAVGLVFPQMGSEQIVLLPDSGTGVRVVKLGATEGDAYLVEVYARDGVQPVQRVELTAAQSLTLPLESGAVALWLEPTVGLNVTVRHAPGAWLLWLALPLMLAGLASLRWKPAFALAQVQPWPVGRAAVTLQTNHRGLQEAVANDTVDAG